MSLLVIKFGGTSLETIDKIKNAAKIVHRKKNEGNKVVVVVSAMAGATNNIISMCKDISELNNKDKLQEYDVALSTGETLSASLFAIALQNLEVKSISMQAWQIKIKSTNSYSSALIEDIDYSSILSFLDSDITPVITGFQGYSNQGRITTIGRGGSDTTAAAVAAAINADYCDIYTDVEGLCTIDPRLVKHAKQISIIGYNEVLELAGMGAKVLHPRCVEICRKFNIKLRIFSTFTEKSGTIVMNHVNETNKISAISYLKNLKLYNIQATSENIENLVLSLANNSINIFHILGTSDNRIRLAISAEYISFVDNLLKELKITNENIEEVGCINIVGVSIRHDTKILHKIIKTLKENNINIIDISNSEISISIFTNENGIENAAKLLHEKFITNE
jgi:aspartate kinase